MLFCIGNLLNSRQRKSVFDVAKEGHWESTDKGLVCYSSIKAYRCFFGFDAPALKCLICLGLNIKYWSSPDLNSMRWLGLFTNKTFRKHLKLIFPHWDFIICIVSLAIFHPHFVIRIFPSAFYHPHFSIRHPPPSGPHFTETRFQVVTCINRLRVHDAAIQWTYVGSLQALTSISTFADTCNILVVFSESIRVWPNAGSSSRFLFLYCYKFVNIFFQ